MTNGGGKFTIMRAVTSNGTVSPLAKLYHYDPGTTDTANIYSDETLTTALAQPFISDSAGRFVFYANGDFDFVIKDAADLTLDTFDDVHISKGESFVNSYGEALPSANLLSKGKGFPVIDSNNVLRKFSINQHTSYVDIYEANASGQRLFNTLIPKTHPYYDITAYGAIAGEAANQASRIQAAIDAIEAVGYGVLFIPEGRFQCDSSLDINNTSIAIMGMGLKSVLVQTANPGTPVIDYDTTDITDTFEAIDFWIETAVSNSNTAIDCTWPSTSGEDSLKNCSIKNVYCGPTATNSATAYFNNGIKLSDAKKPDIDNVFLRGHDSLDGSMTGIDLSGYTEDILIKNLRCHHMLNGITTGANTRNLTVTGGSHFLGATNSITLSGTVGVTITDNLFQKEADSTASWDGIVGTTATSVTITDNRFEDRGSASGTDRGIYLDTVDKGMVSGNISDALNIGITLSANSTNIYAINNFSGVNNNGASNVVYNNSSELAQISFTDGDTTPDVRDSVGPNHFFLTVNTGATSITKLENGYFNQIITIRANDANTTFVHNIIQDGFNLRGDINYAIPNGDTITFQREPLTAGSWSEIARSS